MGYYSYRPTGYAPKVCNFCKWGDTNPEDVNY